MTAHERQYRVEEPLRATQVFLVTARSAAEAIEKVEAGEYDFVDKGEVESAGKLRARWIRPRAEDGPMTAPRLSETPDIEAAIADALEDHVLWDATGKNLGAYRTEWICDCGHAFVVDGHRGETRIGAHRAHVAQALAPVLAAAVREAEQRAWDEGYEAAEHMARCWGHTDSWEDEPENPYRADRIAVDGER